jgi:heme/copper-type cytochrome/quinol oxidase subunit 2
LSTDVHFFWFGVAGTIAPAREIPEQGANSPIRFFFSNLNLVVPVAAAILVIIIAVVVICVLRGKNSHQKGKRHLYVVGTIAPPEQEHTSVNQYFPWVPEWLDLNIVVPIGATVVVIIVGVIVICVALSRRSRGPEQTRLRGKCVMLI